MPREAQEEAAELDAVVERRGREGWRAQSFVEGRGDGATSQTRPVVRRDPARWQRGVRGLVAPSLASSRSDQVGRSARRRPGSCDAQRQLGLVRSARASAAARIAGGGGGVWVRWRKGWRRRRQRSSGRQLGP